MLLMAGTDNFCASTANIWNILGYVVFVFKIVIPLLLIVFGMVDLGKAVVSSDDKAISKAVGMLIRRFIAAVVVFFIPTIVNALFTALGLISTKSDWPLCVRCVTGTCPTEAEKALGNTVE